MVANVQIKRPKIYTGETPVQELQRNFSEELREMGKKAAIEFGCSLEEVKYRFTNDGVVEFEKMSHQEVTEMAARESQQKKVVQIKKDRGVIDE